MGVFGNMKNNKKTSKQRKTMKWKRRQRQVAKEKLPAAELDLDQVQLFSKEMLKKKMKNMKSNVTISNKKRNKLLKRLRHRQNDKEREAMAIEEEMEEVAPAASTSQQKKNKKKKSTEEATMQVDSE